MNIYVGNLSYNTTNEDLSSLFSQYGEVRRASVVIDRETQRSKGFGFVEMNDNAAATAAIEALNNKEFNGRALRINEAKPREDRPRQSRPARF
ncbi:RNA recognition motif domain-containing protein [Thalassolituus sp. LLYu03]|uniref:RNA recognition motif domain-containing protein n=1 Tax=Thalassolituus sp. LLYu03 TaxID=3421656 RepID=UPI003D267B40